MNEKRTLKPARIIKTRKEYFQKYRGKKSAKDILFGWFDYCEKHNIKLRSQRGDKK